MGRELPSIHSEALPGENVNVFFWITKQHLPRQPVRDVAIPKGEARISGPLHLCLARIEYLKGNSKTTSSIYSEALEMENVNKRTV